MLANRIVALRRKKGISQAQLAQVLNISPSAEGMYEQGRRIPNLETLILMSHFFNVSLDYLITGSEFQQSRDEIHQMALDCPCNSCFWKNYVLK